MKNRTRKLLKSLCELANQAGEKAYERICQAREVFGDQLWIMDEFGGDEQKAAQKLETEYLADLCWKPNNCLAILFGILEMFPKKSEWESRQWNISRLYAEYKVAQKKEKDKGKHDVPKYKEISEELEVKCQTLEQTLTQEKERVATQNDELLAEREENKRLREDNAKLLARVAGLEGELKVYRREAS